MSQSPTNNDHLHNTIHQTEHPLRNPREAKSMAQENRLLKKQNELLRRQLENFSIKLDLEIRKKAEEAIRKPWSKQEDVTHKQLENAYKQCQIYKKEASFYKKKVDTLSDEQTNQENEWKVRQLEKENRILSEQMVSLRKIIKMQEKGLAELGVQGYLSLTAEKNKLQEEVRILNKQIDTYRRQQKTQSQGIHKLTHSNIHLSTSKGKVEEQASSKRRVETQPSVKSTKEDNDSLKLKVVIAERDRLKQQLAQNQQMLAEKDKQIQNLRLKIENLRKNNSLLHSRLSIRKNYPEDSSLAEKDRKNMSRVSPQSRKWTKSTTPSNIERPRPTEQQRSVSNMKPQAEATNFTKWSHEAFSSKMLQIQLLIHDKGHIKDIHARYEKGEPKRYSTFSKNTFVSLVCREGEYIKNLSGSFSGGLLQALKVVTSDKREQIFGKSEYLEMKQGCDRFEFNIAGEEYPGALYGEIDEQGVRKLGCVIMKQ